MSLYGHKPTAIELARVPLALRTLATSCPKVFKYYLRRTCRRGLLTQLRLRISRFSGKSSIRTAKRKAAVAACGVDSIDQIRTGQSGSPPAIEGFIGCKRL